MEEKNMAEKDFVVLGELPQVPTRVVQDHEGKEYEVLTTSEALKEILQTIREVKEVLTGKK
jgi:hypothetical protein